MICPKCKDLGWIGTGRFFHDDARYCDCNTGIDLKNRVNQGKLGMKPEDKVSIRTHAEKFSERFYRDMR